MSFDGDQINSRRKKGTAAWASPQSLEHNGIHIPTSPTRTRRLWRGVFAHLWLAVVWPPGWGWESGPPYESHLFMMIVGVYATLGVFLLNAARNPEANLSLIWFTVWSSGVHGAIMAVQSFSSGHHRGHLLGDVPALLLVAVVLAVLVLESGLKQSPSNRACLLSSKQPAGQR
jgi:hypothetical protein